MPPSPSKPSRTGTATGSASGSTAGMQSSTGSASQAQTGAVASKEGAAAATAPQQKRDLRLYTAHELLLFTAIALIVGVSAGYWSAINSCGSMNIAASLAPSHSIPPTSSDSASSTPATSAALPKSKAAPVRRETSKAAPLPAIKPKFALADLAAKFSIDIIDRVTMAPQIAAMLPNIVITDADMELGDNAQFSQYLAESPARGYRAADMAALTHVQFVSKRVQFGLFASAAIARDTVLGEYVGELRELDLWQYAWAYPADLNAAAGPDGDQVEGKEINLVIDATRAGNQLRFVNDGGAASNCRVVYLSVNNTWRIFYQTKRHVAAGEELRVHYAQTSWGRLSLRDTIAEIRQHAAVARMERKRAASAQSGASTSDDDDDTSGEGEGEGEGDGDGHDSSGGGGDKASHPTGGDYALVAQLLAVRTAEFAALTMRDGGAATDALADVAVDTNEFPSLGGRDDDALSIVDADAWVAVMLQRGATNQTYVDVVNKKMGLNSPFKRFAARDMRTVFGIDLIRATIVSPEAESYLRDHEVDLEYAHGNAHTLPWSLYLAEPPVAPYREEDLESQYYIRFSNFVRGHGVFAARDLANGTVLGQYTGLLRQQVGDTDYAWQAYYKRLGDNGSDSDNASGSDSEQGDFMTMQIDSRSIGNAMRFVNDDRVFEKNCAVVHIHKNNLWHVFYQITKPVKQDEEIFISYGEGYWTSRAEK